MIQITSNAVLIFHGSVPCHRSLCERKYYNEIGFIRISVIGKNECLSGCGPQFSLNMMNGKNEPNGQALQTSSEWSLHWPVREQTGLGHKSCPPYHQTDGCLNRCLIIPIWNVLFHFSLHGSVNLGRSPDLKIRSNKFKQTTMIITETWVRCSGQGTQPSGFHFMGLRENTDHQYRTYFKILTVTTL